MNRMDTSYTEVTLSPKRRQSDSVERYQQKTKNKAVGPKPKRTILITNLFLWATEKISV